MNHKRYKDFSVYSVMTKKKPKFKTSQRRVNQQKMLKNSKTLRFKNSIKEYK